MKVLHILNWSQVFKNRPKGNDYDRKKGAWFLNHEDREMLFPMIIDFTVYTKVLGF